LTVRRTVAALVAGLSLVAACTGGDAADEPSSTASSASTDESITSSVPATSTAPTTELPATTTTTEPLDQSRGPTAAPVRHPSTARPIYFVMPDRFANGDTGNDTAGLDGDQLVHGFDPTDRAYHHGGDLAGLTARLPYLSDLGIGAIWITPPFTNRFVQGDGTVEGSSSSYHGYWQIDWDHIDPHLGTEEEMIGFVQAAHALDIDVYFDIVVNHTGDVIRYADDSYVYLTLAAVPYLDADGNAFDPADVAGGDDFPQLDAATSFPHPPTFATESDATAKSPDWLNDVTLYHNRGDSTFQGESSTYGDFYGLDDLFTEHPQVVAGMIDMYGDVIERYDIDGFRVDTMKHVGIEFWERFVPAIRERAAELGKPDFFVFGEVFNEDPISQSTYTNAGVPATLDFIVDGGLGRYLTGGEAALLADAFDDDDWFTDADNNASMQVTFFGNHDEGRLGYRLRNGAVADDEAQLLARAAMAQDLLFLTRGVPVVYYGDEQGFTGSGGDQLARQDMFPTRTADYADDDDIGTDATPADDNFDPEHPLYRHIAELAEFRAAHAAFVTGAQIVHPTEGPVFAFSRIDRDERIEHLVLTNADSSRPVTTTVEVVSGGMTFEPLRGGTGSVTAADDGTVVIEVPPLTTLVYRATGPVEPPSEPPAIAITRPDDDGEIATSRYRIEAELSDRRFAEVTFAVSIDGAAPQVLGVDDAAPYRVYWSNADVPTGASVEIVATVDDGSGRLRSDVATATIGERP
jgi:glycosidase